MPKPKDPWDFIKKKSLILKEAIKCSRQYRQEFEAAFRSFQASTSTGNPYHDQETFNSTDEAKKLCQRWGLAFALHPDDKILDMQGFELAAFAPQCRAVEMLLNGEAKVISFPLRMIPYRKAKPFPSPPEETVLKKIVSRAKPSLNLIKKTVDRRPWLEEGRYLHIKIDLSQSQDQIEAEIKSWVEELRHLVNWTVNPPRQPTKKFTAPPPSEDLSDDEWFKQRQVQEDKKRKFQKDQLKPKRKPSLDINLSPEPPGGPVTIFQAWVMNKREGKSSWKIAQELYPYIKSLAPQKCTIRKCDEKEYFKELTEKTKESYSVRICGKKDLCLEARARLKNVNDAIRRADLFISSIEP
jgi:hypothetical protein